MPKKKFPGGGPTSKRRKKNIKLGKEEEGVLVEFDIARSEPTKCQTTNSSKGLEGEEKTQLAFGKRSQKNTKVTDGGRKDKCYTSCWIKAK